MDITRLTSIKFDYHYFYLIFVFFSFLFSLIVSSYKWKITLLCQKIKVNLKKLVQIVWIAFFFNILLPSTIAGDISRFYYVAKGGKNKNNTFLSIVADRFINMSAGIILGTFTLLLIYDEIEKGIAIFIIAICLSWVFGILLLYKLNYSSISELFKKCDFKWLSHGVLNLKDALEVFLDSKLNLFKVVLLSFLVKFNAVLLVFLITLFLGLNIPFIYLLIFVPIIDVITLIPISIGGLGIRENAYVFFLSKVGILPQEAFAISLILSLSMICWGLIGGGIYLCKR